MHCSSREMEQQQWRENHPRNLIPQSSYGPETFYSPTPREMVQPNFRAQGTDFIMNGVMEEELRRKDTQINVLLEQIDAKDGHIADLQIKCHKLRGLNRAIEKENRSNRKENRSNRKRMRELNSKKIKMNQILHTTENRSNELHQENKLLKDNLTSQKKELKQREEELERHEAEVTKKLEQWAEKLERREAEIKQYLEQWAEELKRREAEINRIE